MLNLHKNSIDLSLFKNILRELKESNNSENLDIIDSFSDNQFKSKGLLLEFVHDLNVLDEEKEIIIFGCWYGSILVPALMPYVKLVTGIDLDDRVIKIAKNRFFKNYNADFITSDVFSKFRGRYSEASLFINTSCEHMAPMNQWPWWQQVSRGAGFAFQSNNMHGIQGHINCVDSIEEFEQQMPENFKVVFKDKLEDDRGTRFTLAGYIL